MRVKWNRNLDGIRPLITVPETDVLSNGKLEDDNDCDNRNAANCETNAVSEVVVTTNGNVSQNKTIHYLSVPSCESPSPSSASITSRRSDKSKTRISNLFGLFKVKDRAPNDANSDCVSNVSELSSATIPSLISPSFAKRKSNYGSRDSLHLSHERIGFEADTRRRRRANTLLTRTSLRRSWQQLNAPNKVAVGSTYVVSRDRLPIVLSHSPSVLRHKSLEPALDVIRSRSPTPQPHNSLSPSRDLSADENNSVETKTKMTGSDANRLPESENGVDIEVEKAANNSMFVMQTVVQTLGCKTNCISTPDLNGKKVCGCDEVDDSRVQSVVNSLDSKLISLNHSTISDPKSNSKFTKDQQNLEFDKNEANSCKSISQNAMQIKANDVKHNDILDTDSESKERLTNKINQKHQTTHQLSATEKLNQTDVNDSDLKTGRQTNDDFDEECSQEKEEQSIALRQTHVTSDGALTSTDSSANIIKVKVKKTQLPESETVCFGTRLVSSANINKCNNDEPVVLTFINDEPMSTRIEDRDYVRNDNIFAKSPSIPIQGILRVRNSSYESDKDNDNTVNSVSKSNSSGKSQKKVHFADSCYTRSSTRGRSRSVKGRHYYGSLNTIRTIRIVPPINDKKKINRIPIQVNTNSSLAAKRVTNHENTGSSSVAKRIPVQVNNTSSLAAKRVPVKANAGPLLAAKRIPVKPNTGPSLAAERAPGQTNTGSAAAPKRTPITRVTTSRVAASKVRTNLVNDDKQKIAKLSQLCETKTKQLKTLGLDNHFMRLAFDSLTVVIQHLNEQFEPFENPKLKEALKKANLRCEQLEDNLDGKDVELNNMKLIFEEQINQLMKEREKNYSDLNLAKVTHESNIKRLKDIHFKDVKRLEDKYNKELETSQQNCSHLINEIEVKNSELSELKQSRDAIEAKARQLEDSILNDKDKKFKYLTEKSKQLELEVESLKIVMDMKNEKIHTLERNMIETQEKINELPFAKETIRSLQQQNETLQITLDRKLQQYNQLTRDHEDLKAEFDREMREKRRLSMRNEELTFHLSESYHESVPGMPGLNNSMPNHDPYDPNPHCFKTPGPKRVLHNDETPIKPNRSISMNCGPTSGSTPHVFSRKSHPKVSRSASMAATTGHLSESARNNSFICCPPSVSQKDNLPNEESDEVFDSGTGFSDHMIAETSKRSVKVKQIDRLNEETPPQCILDSGFDEFETAVGLNSLFK